MVSSCCRPFCSPPKARPRRFLLSPADLCDSHLRRRARGTAALSTATYDFSSATLQHEQVRHQGEFLGSGARDYSTPSLPTSDGIGFRTLSAQSLAVFLAAGSQSGICARRRDPSSRPHMDREFSPTCADRQVSKTAGSGFSDAAENDLAPVTIITFRVTALPGLTSASRARRADPQPRPPEMDATAHSRHILCSGVSV